MRARSRRSAVRAALCLAAAPAVIVALVVSGPSGAGAQQLPGDPLALSPSGLADPLGPIAPAQFRPGSVDAAAAAAQVRERREWLVSPGAVAQRSASLTAFAGLSGSGALALAREQFPATVERPSWEPPRLAPGERFAGFVSDYALRIDRPGGTGNAIVESSVPLRAIDERGKAALVSVALEDRGEFFAPANPLVASRIPKRLADGVSLGRPGLTLRLAGAPAGVLARTVGGKAFYPGVSTDTDMLVGPTPTGVATFFQLRSPASPAELSLDFELPAGVSLRTISAPESTAGAVAF